MRQLCALIWLAGSKKWVDRAGVIQWHRAYVVKDRHNTKEIAEKIDSLIISNAYVGLYLGMLGFDWHAVDLLMTGKLVSLTPALAQELGLEYGIVSNTASEAGGMLRRRRSGGTTTAARASSERYGRGRSQYGHHRRRRTVFHVPERELFCR